MIEQNISTATIRLKRDLNWARRQVRLLGSLSGFATATNRDLAQSTFAILQASRLLGSPVNLEFILLHDESGSKGQTLRIAMTQVLEESPKHDSLVAYHAAIDEALEKGFAVESLLPGSSSDEAVIKTDLSIPLTVDSIAPEVASNWNTILASGSTDSALANSQQSMGQLARSLAEANARGADLEQELSSLKKLNETLELLSLVASKTDNGVVIANRQGEIDWANHSFERLVELSLQDLVGSNLVQLVERYIKQDDEESKSSVDELSGAIQLGIAFHATLPFNNVDATSFVVPLLGGIDPGSASIPAKAGTTSSSQVRWVSLNVTPVFDDRGTVTRWIAMASDVSQQRQQQQMLELARERAEQASKLKGDFMANISHEIRTPMNAIVGMTELLLDTQLDQNQQEYAAIVHDSSASLLQLLNDVLDLSKIEAGQLAIHDADFSLQKTVRSVAATFSLQAERAGITLDCDVAKGVPDLLTGDPVRLRQILMNLVGNAVKFTASGGVTVKVERAELGKPNSESVRLRFQVSDTGIGITDEAMQRIFEPFMQAERDTAHVFGGTGLGLAICIELTRLMNGKMWAESESEVGSHFYFECDFKISEAATLDSDSHSLTSAEVETIADNANALRILVADDQAPNRLLLRRILEKCNHFVEEAVDGAEAIAMVQANAYDLLLLDIRMPNVDGIEAARQILAIRDSLPKLPKIVAVTANVRPEDRQSYLDAGMDDFLPKPISARDLLAMVETTVAEVVDSANDDAIRAKAGTAIDDRFAKPLERMENDIEMLREQMQFFIEDVPAVILELESSLQAADSRTTELLAHRLKGMALSFDAADLAETAAELERNPEIENASELRTCIAKLRDSYAGIAAEIRRYLHN